MGTNAVSINPNVNSDGEGAFTLKGESIDLKVPESMFAGAQSVRFKFDHMSHEGFAWLINAGRERFRLGNKRDGDDETKHGLWLRYFTYDDTNDNGVIDPAEEPSIKLIDSNPIADSKITEGERAIVEFNYNHETGIAQVLKNNVVVWETPPAQQTPGTKFYLDTEDGTLIVGNAMDGDGSTTPSLYSFDAWSSACGEVPAPRVVEGSNCGEGRVTLTASGTSNGNYRWYNPEGELMENEVNENYTTAALSASQTFFVAVVESGCESEKIPVQAQIFSKPNPPQLMDAKSCGADQLTLQASGAEEGNYRWYTATDPNTPIEDAYGSSFTTPFLSETTDFYVAVVNDFCESAKVKAQAVIDEVPATPKVGDIEICEPGEIALTLEKEEGTILWWYRSATIGEVLYEDEAGFFNPTIMGDTTFYVSVRNSVCESPRVALNIRIQKSSLLNAGEDIRKFYEDSVQLKASGDGNLNEILWHPSTGLSNTNIPDPIAFPEKTTTYTVSAINSNGCEVSDHVTVFVADFPVPTAFSPNEDGLNDTWEIPYIHRYPDCEVIVYNRWGNAIFHSKGYRKSWDGWFENEIVSSGQYVYYINLNNGKEPLKGMLYVKR